MCALFLFMGNVGHLGVLGYKTLKFTELEVIFIAARKEWLAHCSLRAAHISVGMHAVLYLRSSGDTPFSYYSKDVGGLLIWTYSVHTRSVVRISCAPCPVRRFLLVLYFSDLYKRTVCTLGFLRALARSSECSHVGCHVALGSRLCRCLQMGAYKSPIT
jgi:hypothetical protein